MTIDSILEDMREIVEQKFVTPGLFKVSGEQHDIDKHIRKRVILLQREKIMNNNGIFQNSVEANKYAVICHHRNQEVTKDILQGAVRHFSQLKIPVLNIFYMGADSVFFKKKKREELNKYVKGANNEMDLDYIHSLNILEHSFDVESNVYLDVVSRVLKKVIFKRVIGDYSRSERVPDFVEQVKKLEGLKIADRTSKFNNDVSLTNFYSSGYNLGSLRQQTENEKQYVKDRKEMPLFFSDFPQANLG